MAGVEKTWAGRVRLGMKVVMIGLIVVVEVVVDVVVESSSLHLLSISHVVVPYHVLVRC